MWDSVAGPQDHGLSGRWTPQCLSPQVPWPVLPDIALLLGSLSWLHCLLVLEYYLSV